MHDGTDPGRLRLGVIANEVFALEVGRMGGFGWAVRQVADLFTREPELGIDVSLFVAERPHAEHLPATLHGSPVVWPAGSRMAQVRAARRAAPDLFLGIDYRSGYRRWLYAKPRTPVIIWVRDPWAPADRERVRTLRLPDQPDVAPQGVRGPDPGSLRQVTDQSRAFGRPLLFGATARELADRVPGTYGVTPRKVSILPNIVAPAENGIRKPDKPLVAFLARLDPVKRPWLFAALAERFPDIDFVAMGQSHFRGPGTWQPESPPPNLRMVGHAGEKEKQRILSDAWVLVNTSIHEGLSVSFLEALAREVPVISSVNPDDVVSRFGTFVGRAQGSGTELLPRFEDALRRMLEDHAERKRLGTAGRAFVEATHSRETFLASFEDLIRQAGLPTPAGLRATEAVA
jgi:glycosyltransferase involved in cell wall biosynthesis